LYSTHFCLIRNSSADSSATSSQFFNAQESVYCLAEAASARLGRLGDIFSCSIVGSKDHKKVNRKIKSENYSLHAFFPAVSHQEVKEARNNTSQYYSTIEANLEALCSIEGKVQKRGSSLLSSIMRQFHSFALSQTHRLLSILNLILSLNSDVM
jgi:hypothetical protein